MNPVLLDFESRSRADLKAIGGRQYWAHPSTESLCCAWYDTANGDVGVWRPGEDWPHHGRILAAHNATGFDAFGARRLGWCDDDWSHWIDTSELARMAGLPGALEALGGAEKDKVASRFTISLSSCRRPKSISADVWRGLSGSEKRNRGDQPPITEEVLAQVIPYCLTDVEIMAYAWPTLEPWLDIEPEVRATSAVVNERGIGFDVELARALLRCDAQLAEDVTYRAGFDLGWSAERTRAAAMSPKQFCECTGAADARAETVATMVHPLADVRRALASISAGKLTAGLNRVCPDGRLRDTLRYYGTHTGRWAGKGMQLHNLPRPHESFKKWTADQVARLIDQVKAGTYFATRSEIDLLVRYCLVARPGHMFVVQDYTGVEARMLAWCARDTDALKVFSDPARDPYIEMAAVIFGVPASSIAKEDGRRQVGKIAELACGYGMGGDKFGATASAFGINLTAMGVDPKRVVRAWREKHAPIVRFWRDCERAWVQALKSGQANVAGLFDFVLSTDGRDLAVLLPSGRPIVFNGAGIDADEGLVFRGTRGPEHTHGGKLAENLIQASCRDPLADALVRSEVEGLCPVLTVHDEIVAEVPASAAAEGQELLHQIMLDVPDWAHGFPVGAAGFTSERYRK